MKVHIDPEKMRYRIYKNFIYSLISILGRDKFPTDWKDKLRKITQAEINAVRKVLVDGLDIGTIRKDIVKAELVYYTKESDTPGYYFLTKKGAYTAL